MKSKSTQNKITVYLVMACWDYGGGEPIRAFYSYEQAKVFADKCTAHHAKKPVCPEIESTPENDILWDKFTKNEKRWEIKHPAGEDNATCDSFSMPSINLFVEEA